jgi:hypothetical protein
MKPLTSDKQKELLQKKFEEGKDLQRLMLKILDNDEGKKIIDYLDKYAHYNFPNYENVNATYAKAGQQQLVEHIRQVIITAKRGGE